MPAWLTPAMDSRLDSFLSTASFTVTVDAAWTPAQRTMHAPLQGGRIRGEHALRRTLKGFRHTCRGCCAFREEQHSDTGPVS